MRKINEQWIEDGRMYKAVKQRPEISHIEDKIHPCHKCLFQMDDYDCAYPSPDWKCDMKYGLIIKDLGPVNKDGCLAEERTGEFPIITEWASIIGFGTTWTVCVVKTGVISVMVWGKTCQQAIDAWNQREATNEF